MRSPAANGLNRILRDRGWAYLGSHRMLSCYCQFSCDRGKRVPPLPRCFGTDSKVSRRRLRRDAPIQGIQESSTTVNMQRFLARKKEETESRLTPARRKPLLRFQGSKRGGVRRKGAGNGRLGSY